MTPAHVTLILLAAYLIGAIPFGWLVRAIHCWSAHLMIGCLLVHMFSTMMLKAYRPPRELTWVTGYALFAVTLCFGFSGYLLPWNELAFFATAVGTDSVKSIPLVGGWMLQVLRGGTERHTESGVAVFEDLHIDRTGSGFRLQARAGGLTVDSEPFRVYDD